MGDGVIENPYGTTDGDTAVSRSILLVADMHPEREDDGFRDRLRYSIIKDNLEQIAAEYDADEAWFGGDLGNYDDVQAYADYDFDRVKFVIGDEDRKQFGWYQQMCDRDEEDVFCTEPGQEYGRKVVTTVPAETPYLIEAAHEPAAFDIGATTTDARYQQEVEQLGAAPDHQLDTPKIAVYGHEHKPFARVVRNALVIGLGSTYENYGIDKDVRDVFPETSVHVLQVVGQDVDVYHIDYDTGDVFEHQQFRFDGTQFADKTTEHVMDVGQRFIKGDPAP